MGPIFPSSLPSSFTPAGMTIEKWLKVNKDQLDLRDRQLVLQQVINLLAVIDIVGRDDKLCLWGSFIGKSA